MYCYIISDNRYLHNGVLISQEFQFISLAKLRKICVSKVHIRGRSLKDRISLYNIILSLDNTVQQEIIKAVRRELMPHSNQGGEGQTNHVYETHVSTSHIIEVINM